MMSKRKEAEMLLKTVCEQLGLRAGYEKGEYYFDVRQAAVYGDKTLRIMCDASEKHHLQHPELWLNSADMILFLKGVEAATAMIFRGAEVLKLMPLHFIELGEKVGKMSDSQKQEFEKQADHVAIWAAETATYLGERGANGCGDNGHVKAMKAVEKTRKRVRKALGYTAP